MLQIYIKAEHLKFKRSLFRKLLVLVPAALALASIILLYVGMGFGIFSSVMVCNWCMPFASLSIVLLCHLVNSKEQKHQYRTLYCLPINLKKTFLAKVILTAFQLLGISFVLALMTAVMESMAAGSLAAFANTGYYILGYFLMWITLLWQIPFCLLLDQKLGFIGSLLLNLFASALGGLFLYLTPLFWFFPHSWTARFMTTLFGVLTNGLMIEPDSRLILSLGEGLLLTGLSLLAAFLLSALTARWYERQVYRR